MRGNSVSFWGAIKERLKAAPVSDYAVMSRMLMPLCNAVDGAEAPQQ